MWNQEGKNSQMKTIRLTEGTVRVVCKEPTICILPHPPAPIKVLKDGPEDLTITSKDGTIIFSNSSPQQAGYACISLQGTPTGDWCVYSTLGRWAIGGRDAE